MAVERPNSAVNITTNTTTTIGGAGAHANLYRVNINKAGAAANLLSIYLGQSASGTLIATIDTTVVRNFDFGGLRSKDGFTFVTATGTAADLTVVFD